MAQFVRKNVHTAKFPESRIVFIGQIDNDALDACNARAKLEFDPDTTEYIVTVAKGDKQESERIFAKFIPQFEVNDYDNFNILKVVDRLLVKVC